MVPVQGRGVITVILGLLLLSAVRLVSERPLFTRVQERQRRGLWRRWWPVRTGNHSRTRGKVDKKFRTFGQYLSETIWACGAGVIAAHWDT